MEIERKFLIDRYPDELPLLRETVVFQGYIATNPVVRIRVSEETDGTRQYILCFKGKGTLVRQEIEWPITAEQFGQLETLLKAPMIRKDYKVYALENGRQLEVSLVDAGTPDAFMYAEVEFPSLEEAKAYLPEPCLGEEVTEAPWFSMSSYWQRKVDAAAASSEKK